jgi:hypothetical protein
VQKSCELTPWWMWATRRSATTAGAPRLGRAAGAPGCRGEGGDALHAQPRVLHRRLQDALLGRCQDRLRSGTMRIGSARTAAFGVLDVIALGIPRGARGVGTASS